VENHLNDTEKKARRVKASEHAVRVALKAAKDAGLPVDKMCITGGQIVIHFAGIAGAADEEDDSGLEKW
jgi:hypothetical protein